MISTKTSCNAMMHNIVGSDYIYIVPAMDSYAMCTCILVSLVCIANHNCIWNYGGHIPEIM